jgi:hypothetical protein
VLALNVFMALALPPPAEVAGDDAVVYLHAPRVWSRLQELEASAFAPLVPLFLPTADRQKLEAQKGGDLLAVVCRNNETRSLDYWVGLDGGQSLFLFDADGRCGLASRQTLGLDAATASAKPLAKDPELTSLASTWADAALRGRANIQKYYGYLARTAGGGYLSGVVRRLGLDSVVAATFATFLRSKKRLETEVRFVAPRPWQGVLDSLGPALPVEWPAEVPKAALGFVRVSLRPTRLWVVVQKLLAQASAIEFTLAQAQLDAMQEEVKVRVEEALGDEPRTWVLYAVANGARPDLVLVAPVLDAAGLGRVVERYARVLPNIAPDLKVDVRDGAVGRVVSFGWARRQGEPFLVIGIDAGKESRFIVASSRPAFDAFAGRRGKVRSQDGEPAVLSGVVQDQALALWLYDLGEKPTGSAAAELGGRLRRTALKRRDLEAVLNSSSFALRATEEGAALTITTTAK